MFSLFGFNKTEKKEPNVDKSISAFERLQIFLKKLDDRAEEITKEVEESAQLIADADTDPYKRSFLQFKSAIIAQFAQIVQKASKVYESQVIPSARGMEMLDIATYYSDWNTRMIRKMEHLFHGVLERDLEKEYLLIMNEYQEKATVFHCMQCGADLVIDRFYFQSVYIACTYCQTQNTFDPGSKARLVQDFAQPLARARCNELFQRYLKKKAQSSKKEAKSAYEAYIDKIIVEMDLILPGMQEQHANYRSRMMKDFENEIIPW